MFPIAIVFSENSFAYVAPYSAFFTFITSVLDYIETLRRLLNGYIGLNACFYILQKLIFVELIMASTFLIRNPEKHGAKIDPVIFNVLVRRFVEKRKTWNNCSAYPL